MIQSMTMYDPAKFDKEKNDVIKLLEPLISKMVK